MNTMLAWLSTRLPIGDGGVGSVIFPNFEKAPSSAPDFKGQTLLEFYNQGGDYGNSNPGREAVNFYEAFSNYLSTSAEWEELFRLPGALLGLLMWYIAEALRFFYLMLFKLMRISNITDSASGRKFGGGSKTFNYGPWHLHQLFIDSNKFGLIIFAIVLFFYLCGTVINSPTYQRYKNIFRNALLILFFLFVLPSVTSAFGKGVNDISQGMLNPKQEKTSQNDPNDIGNLAFEDNVVSVPVRAESTAPGKDILTGASGRKYIYRMRNAQPIEGLSPNADPLFIDLSQMSPSETDAWNGIAGHEVSVPQFLRDYASPSDLMNKDALPHYADASAENYSKAHGTSEYGSSVQEGAHNAGTAMQNYNYLNQSPNFWTGLADVVRVPMAFVAHWGGGALANMTSSDYSKNYKTLFSYGIENNGPGIGASEAEKGMSSHSLEILSGQSTFSGSIAISKQFARSYSFYHVNWLAIYAQLGMIILIMGTFIMKLIKMIFKLVVMYISSGLVLFRNADNYQRLKNWMRDLFSIYEMAIMDVIMIYVTLYIIYPAYHQYNDYIMAKSQNTFLANPYSIAVVNLICDFALFQASIKGVNAVNSMAGSQGGGANSGAGSMFSSIVGGTLAVGGARTALNTGKSLGKTALITGGATAGAFGKHLYDKHLGRKGKRDKDKPGRNNRSGGHGHGGLLKNFFGRNRVGRGTKTGLRDNKGNVLRRDKQGDLFHRDKNGNHVYKDKNGDNYFKNKAGDPYYKDKQGDHYQKDKNGQAYYRDNNGHKFYKDKAGDHYFKSKGGSPYYKDKNGDHYYKDSNGKAFYMNSGGAYQKDNHGHIQYLSRNKQGDVDGFKENPFQTNKPNGSNHSYQSFTQKNPKSDFDSNKNGNSDYSNNNFNKFSSSHNEFGYSKNDFGHNDFGQHNQNNQQDRHDHHDHHDHHDNHKK